jgi:hypothetical protein
MLNKGINFNILYYYILKYIAHVTCLFIISISCSKGESSIK